MAKRKQQKILKVEVNFTPTIDWDARLKKVMELLLRYPHNVDTNNRNGGGKNAQRR